MHNRTPAVGLLSGIGSTPFFAPIALKTLISKEPLEENDRLLALYQSGFQCGALFFHELFHLLLQSCIFVNILADGDFQIGSIVEPVSYTHLDVYKRQELYGRVEYL